MNRRRTMTLYAIADTDGGRDEPKPLIRYTYESKARAESARQYHGLDPEYYPIVPVTITVVDEAIPA